MSVLAPLCFVLMPFGKKTDPSGLTIDFDAIYEDVMKPAIVEAGLEPLQGGEEMKGGMIDNPTSEQLILCPFAVVDLTAADADVYYQLGLRHATRPASTVIVLAEGSRILFDRAALQAVMYRLTSDGRPADGSSARAALTTKLREARQATDPTKPFVDSPIFQLVEAFPNIQHQKTDVFRDRVNYARKRKEELAQARCSGIDALIEFEKSLADLNAVESAVLIDLFLSYRSVKGWKQMVELAAKMPSPLSTTAMVQEQLALALNRMGQDSQAESILVALLESRGPSSETYGILGRVYKDRYERAEKSGDRAASRRELDKAIDAYLKGFESDWRDAYPGINAATLMELRDPPDPRQKELIPVVAYAVKRKIASGSADYWDYATLLELAVLARDEHNVLEILGATISRVREKWEPETTIKNIGLIASARQSRGEASPVWLRTVLSDLQKAAA